VEAHKELRNTIVRLLSNMASAKEIQQYLRRFSKLDAAKFAVVKVGGAVLEDDLESLVSSLAFLQQVGLARREDRNQGAEQSFGGERALLKVGHVDWL